MKLIFLLLSLTQLSFLNGFLLFENFMQHDLFKLIFRLINWNSRVKILNNSWRDSIDEEKMQISSAEVIVWDVIRPSLQPLGCFDNLQITLLIYTVDWII